MSRTYVVTGAASGIGAATADLLAATDAKVIRCDLREGDITADLSTPEGRDALVAGVREATGGVVDGVVAVAGVGAPDAVTVRLNFFGAVSTLEALRPMLAASSAPRAAVVSSLASIMPIDEAIVAACLAGDEAAAVAAADAAVAAKKGRIIYGSTKRAVNRWVRRTAPSAAWAGAGIPLNAVAPGVVDTPAAQDLIADPATRETVQAAMPQPLGFPGPVAPVASMLAWLVGPDNSFLTGQVLFVDGGAEVTLRGETTEAASVQIGGLQKLRLVAKFAAAKLRHRRT